MRFSIPVFHRSFRSLSALVLMTAGANALSAPTAPSSTAAHLTGDYVEARSCNVYIGACHANGEIVTVGREALMAWQVKQGRAQGETLNGFNAVAVVVGSDNLAQEKAERRSILYVDARANAAQQKALADTLSAQYSKALGEVVAVKTAPISFRRQGLEYTVRIPETAYLKTNRFACNHCVMPHSIWYEPFVGLKNSLVAKAGLNEYKGAPELAAQWRRTEENSSFVGEFAF